MKRPTMARQKLVILIVFLLIIGLYAWTYATAPFSGANNAYILNGTTTLSALLVSLSLTRLTFYYHAGEPPRTIWTSFAVCAWLWTIAEAYWGYLYTTVGEVPAFSTADVLWLIGYIALTVSLVRQFQLVFFTQENIIPWAAFGAWLATIVGVETTLLVTNSESPLVDFFRYFYSLADTAVGLAALYLVAAFRGRALAMPWLAISSFVVTDILYIQLTESGTYDYVMGGISIALLADTLYVAAYLIVAWGVLSQLMLLQIGAGHSDGED